MTGWAAKAGVAMALMKVIVALISVSLRDIRRMERGRLFVIDSLMISLPPR
jgi:hypothetical protein